MLPWNHSSQDSKLNPAMHTNLRHSKKRTCLYLSISKNVITECEGTL